MPAHITVLYPFLEEGSLSDAVLADLSDLCAGRPPIEVVFRRTGRFPDVLYLDPEPADGLRQLTLALAQRWRERPPYGGEFEEVIPHLTVAHGTGEAALAEIEAAVLAALPIRARLEEACVYVFDGARWLLRARLPFGHAETS
jgi:2'-5' RNA ligase